jgi:alpha-D-ribose 1-methylphosphonate 5-triphosphate synthase subunit PhnG
MFAANAPHNPIADDEPMQRRQRLMGICVAASLTELSSAVAALTALPGFEELRAPEIGLVMVRGRIGGGPQLFNLGEATVTRACIRLATGETGHAYLLGRHKEKARLAAILDAAGQRREFAAKIEDHFIAPVSQRVVAAHARRQSETEATRVNFFTLVRGEDAR